MKISQRSTALFLVITVVLGVTLLSAGAWLLSAVLGLFVTGLLVLAAGHWLAYLWMRGGQQ